MEDKISENSVISFLKKFWRGISAIILVAAGAVTVIPALRENLLLAGLVVLALFIASLLLV